MNNLNEVIKAMKSTDQIPGKQSVWDHGISVREYLCDLTDTLSKEDYKSKKQWNIPEVFKDKIWLNYLYDKPTLCRYALFHDIGKPFVLQKDEKG